MCLVTTAPVNTNSPTVLSSSFTHTEIEEVQINPPCSGRVCLELFRGGFRWLQSLASLLPCRFLWPMLTDCNGWCLTSVWWWWGSALLKRWSWEKLMGIWGLWKEPMYSWGFLLVAATPPPPVWSLSHSLCHCEDHNQSTKRWKCPTLDHRP